MRTWWIVALTMAVQGTEPTGIPAAPPARHWIVDEAAVLDSAEERLVDSLATARAAHAMPIYVLTIRSVAAHDTTDISFEAFSRRTFDAWRATRPGADRAAMLIVSIEDRRARIEPGPGWGREHDAALQQIMTDAIEPAMSRGSLDRGIVQAAREMTWALKAPVVSTWMQDVLMAAGVVLGGALVLGFLRRRRAARPAPAAPAATPRPMAAVDPNLRVSQRLQAISDARKQSEKAASTIAWLETGELAKYEGERPPEAGKPRDADDE